MADGKVEIGLGLEDDGLGKEAEAAGRKAGAEYGRSFESAAGNALKNLAATAAVAGAAATAAITKQALDAFAEQEQLIGGINKLFGENSAQIQAYAEQAYKTAGINANSYMSTVTSFSANLIRSLGGDTAAAAEYANMAIQDMADNANTFGLTMEEIQATYQSLARGNYAMLDNLSLGYAGTKAGLQQLLDDAEAFKAAQGEVADYSIDSYADIVEAIHVVQEEMGITGTTAKEAAGTIAGSISSATAAWEDWLAKLGSGEGVTEATNNLVNAIGVAAQNVVPVLSTILTTLKDMFVQALRDLVDTLVRNDPEMHAKAYEMFMKVVDAVIEIAPLVLAALGMLIVNAIGVLIHAAADFFMQGVALVGKVAEGVGNAAGQVKDEFVQGVRDAWNGVKSWASSFWSAGGSLIDGLIGGVQAKVGQLASAAANAAHSALAAAKSALGIASPSKEFFKVGEWSVEGMEKGLEARKASLMASVGGVASDMLSAATPRFSMAGATSTTTTYTFGDVHLNASDAYGITAIEQLVELIETA